MFSLDLKSQSVVECYMVYMVFFQVMETCQSFNGQVFLFPFLYSTTHQVSEREKDGLLNMFQCAFQRIIKKKKVFFGCCFTSLSTNFRIRINAMDDSLCNFRIILQWNLLSVNSSSPFDRIVVSPPEKSGHVTVTFIELVNN